MKLAGISVLLFGLTLIISNTGFSDEPTNQVSSDSKSHIEAFLDCGRSHDRVVPCSSKFLAQSLMKEDRDKIVLWLLRSHRHRKIESCNESQIKVIQAAGYADRPYVCLKHKSDDSAWGFLTYEIKSGSVQITRVKDR
jgi:hypothetical protein